VVSAIAGQSRFEITFTGEAGHAGTVPMAQRRDALVAASTFVAAVPATIPDDVVATVGKLSVKPGAANVIPGRVDISLDVRSPEDRKRESASRDLLALAERQSKDVAVQVTPVSERAAVACSPRLSRLLKEAIGEHGVEISSGAGHDGVYMSEITDVAMLFVRCKGGISHNPAESVTEADVATALDVLGRFLELL